MHEQVVKAYVWQWTARAALAERLARDERGEGVISTAIAVLVMAFLGAVMWVGFRATLGNAQTNIDTQVNRIGQ